MATKVSKDAVMASLTVKDAVQVFINKGLEACDFLDAALDKPYADPIIKIGARDVRKWLNLLNAAIELVDDQQAIDIPF